MVHGLDILPHMYTSVKFYDVIDTTEQYFRRNNKISKEISMEKSKYRQKQKFDFTPYEGQSDAQLLDTGKHWVDSNNFYNLQTCFDLITALRDKEKCSVAVELSQYLFEKVPSARNLNAWMVSVIDEGYIDKQIDMLNQIEDKLKICNVEFDRNIFATWLKTI